MTGMLFCVSVTPYSASAATTLPARATGNPNFEQIGGRVGVDGVSLETTSASIAAGTPFGYKARVVLRSPADSVRMRFRLTHPAGRLIFQRTKTLKDQDRGTVQAVFERETEDLDLRPGVYPLSLEVGVGRDGTVQEATLQGRLLIYEPDDRRTPVAVVLQVRGQPLSDPNGRFIADPARYAQAREDVREVAAWVVANPRARVTLAVAPVLLEEWSRIAGGYELVGPEGTEQVPAGSQVAQAYADTLRALAQAVGTGRLELTTQGFSDPNLASLATAGLIDDVSVQYERGVSTVFASLEASTSAGTVPAGGSIPPAAVRTLVGQGIRYAVVNAASTRTGDSTAQPSSYGTTGGLIALVPDEGFSRSLSSGDASACVSTAFTRHVEQQPAGPLIASVPLGAGGADVSVVRATLDGLFGQPWVRPATAALVAEKTTRRTRLVYSRRSDGSPAGYWEQTRAARRWASALLAAEGEASGQAARAVRDSLVAECSAWSDPEGTWPLADRGRSFADAARRLASETLDKVSIRVEPVTLAGNGGDVPVVVVNDSDRTLTVRLRVRAGRGIDLAGPKRQTLELAPGETFVEVPVRLHNALAGTLGVAVDAGAVELDDRTVTLRGSYVDRVVTIVAVILLLAVLLIVIIRRVKSAERVGLDAEGNGEAYTVGTSRRRTGE